MDTNKAFLKLATLTRLRRVFWVKEHDAYHTPYKGFTVYLWPEHKKIGVLNRQKLDIGPVVMPVSETVFTTLRREVEEATKPAPEVVAMVDELIDSLLAE